MNASASVVIARMRITLGSNPGFAFQRMVTGRSRLRECEGEVGGYLMAAASYDLGSDHVFIAYWLTPISVHGLDRWIFAVIRSPRTDDVTRLRQALFTLQIPNALPTQGTSHD